MFIASEEGQGLIEYALILALVAMIVVMIVSVFGARLRVLYELVTALSAWS